MTFTSSRKVVRGAVAAIAFSSFLVAYAGVALAQSPYYWDPTASGGSAAGGSGTWSLSGTNWWNGSIDTAWSDGNDAYFAGSAGSVTIPSTPTSTANNLYFNTSGYALSGGAINLSGGTITAPTGGTATISSLLNIQNNYSVQGGGTLVLVGQTGAPGSGKSILATTNSSSMNIDSGTTLVLANSTGNFATLAQTALGAGGTINGNLVISQPYQEIEFMPYAGTAHQPAPGTSYTFSGSGAIYVAAPATSLATHKNQNTGTQGWISNVDVPIYLNSSNLPFTPFDVTKPVFASNPVFGTAIAATKWSTMHLNAPISGNADVLLTCNTYASGWGGSAITYLDAQCTYTGATMLEGNGALDTTHGGLASIPPGTGSLILGVSNALPVATNVEFDALTGNPTQYPVLDLNGNNTQIGSLTVPSWVTNQSKAIFIGNNAAGSVATLTVSGATTPYYSFGGNLVDSPIATLAYLTGGTATGGTLALVKDGPNTLNLSGSNTYTGGTTIKGGYLQASNPAGMVNASATGLGTVNVSGGALAGSSLGGSVAGAVTVQSGGEIMPGGVNASGAPLSLGSSLTMQANSLLSFVNGAHTSTGSAQVQAAGALSLPTVPNSVTVDVVPQSGLHSVIPLFSYSSLTGSIDSLVLGDSASLPAGYSFVLDSSLGSLGSNNPNQIDLYNPNVINPIPVTWNAGATGTWDTNSANTVWQATGGSAVAFTANGLATFSDIGGVNSSVVTIAASGVQPGSVTVSNSNTSYTFTGGPITGYATLIAGTGMTTLAATNSYTGGTYVTGGTLVAAAGDGSLGSSVGGLYLDNGASFVTSTVGLSSSRGVYIATTGGSTDTNATFNTNGLNSTLSGNVIVGNASVSGTFAKTGPGLLNLAGNTALTDASNSTGAVLSVQGGTLQVSGPLTLGSFGSMNVGSSGTLEFSSTAAETELFNGSVINGKFVIDQPTDLYVNHGVISGTGQIYVTAPQGVVISNHSNSNGGTINTNIVLNSGGLPFGKTDVTQKTINTTGPNSFIVSIGGDINTSAQDSGTITVNGVISGSSDVNFSPNSTGGGGGGGTAPSLILGASNTYTGATFIAFGKASVVQLNVSNALPIGTDLFFGKPDGTADAAGASLDLHGNNQQIGSLCTATGGTKSQNYTITNYAQSTLATLSVSGATTPYEPFAGTIADFGAGIVALAKSGANTLVLVGPNNYSGGTNVYGGMLIINNPNSQQTAIGTGNLTVSGGTFGGSGNFGDPFYDNNGIVPTFSISAGAALYVGVPASGTTANSNATLSVFGNLNMAAGSALDFDFGSGSASQLAVGNHNASLNLPGAGSVAVNLTNVNGLSGTMELIGWENGSLTGGTNALTLGSAPSGASYAFSADPSGAGIDLTITPSSTAAVTLSGGTTSWGAVLTTTPTTAVTVSTSPGAFSTLALNADQTVGSLVFNASNGQIVIDKGATGTLTFGSSASSVSPTVLVNSGSVDIAASTHLDGNLTVTLSNGSTLQFGNVHQDVAGSSLTVMGNGQLMLSGSGLWTGGTIVEGGTVTLENAWSVQAGTKLTVGDPSVFTGGPVIGATERQMVAGGAVAAVPEPGALALLAAGLSLVGLRIATRRKK